MINLKGKKFGYWEVESFFGIKLKTYYWICKCKCGIKKQISGTQLTSGRSKSCGCYRLQKQTKHGMTIGGKSRFYKIWENLHTRINNPKHQNYNNYGSRGIKCEWKSFEEFKNDMYQSYLSHSKKHTEKNTTLDRIDNNGNYSKENCRWATREAQANNLRCNNIIYWKNKKYTISQIAKKFKINKKTLWGRLYRYKIPIEKALFMPGRTSA